MIIIKGIKQYGINTTGQNLIVINPEGSTRIFTTFNEANHKIVEVNHDYALLPGWLDSHIHGNAGYDFSDNDLTPLKLQKISQSLGKAGLAYCTPTFVSMNLDALKRNITIIDTFIHNQTKQGAQPGECQFIGIHLEGPFISKHCCGAHDINVLQSEINANTMMTLLDAAPHIPIWKITLAPELSGAMEFIDTIKNRRHGQKVSVFIGHSNAEDNDLTKALQKGVIGFTHLGNANSETAQRKTNLTYHDLTSRVVKFVLNDSNQSTPFFFELITDSRHLSDAFVKLATHQRKHQALLVTDALAPTGLKDGKYYLGSREIEKKGDVFYLTNTNTLAGSGNHYADIVKNYSRITEQEGEALWELIYHATINNPRKSLQLDSTYFNDEKNFIVIDKKGALMMSVCNGKTFYHHPPFKTRLLGDR